nr:hypothetical protein [Kineococcus aurantiacus]
MVDCLHEVPAVLRSRHLDVLASNQLARRLTAAFEPGVNVARFAFLNPIVPDLTPDWVTFTRLVAETLRASLERHREDARFRALVGELAARSDDFNRAWAGPRPEPPGTGQFGWEHPVVGRLALAYQELRARGGEDGEVLVLWRPVDGVSAERLERLRTGGDPVPG